LLQEILQEKEYFVIDESLKGKICKALSGAEKVRSFQRKIYLKAKQGGK
jgi:hypothetical protein